MVFKTLDISLQWTVILRAGKQMRQIIQLPQLMAVRKFPGHCAESEIKVERAEMEIHCWEVLILYVARGTIIS